jgi:GT2 family glycosyltransferase
MIYVVVPVYNRKPLVERFLQCMSEQTFRNFTVIIVDDGSTDGTAAMIEEKFPDVQILHGDENLWWTGATNIGVRHAMLEAVADDAVLIINDFSKSTLHIFQRCIGHGRRCRTR